jgi:hypothetical protein
LIRRDLTAAQGGELIALRKVACQGTKHRGDRTGSGVALHKRPITRLHGVRSGFFNADILWWSLHETVFTSISQAARKMPQMIS